jgi:predicted nuclease of predicted toxin-antitoxin system
MRILLDESLPKALQTRLVGHDAVTVVSSGWSGVKNGKLLALAATRFDVFLTADQNLEYQQNLKSLPLAVVVLIVLNNRIETIDPLIPELLRALQALAPRSLCRVGRAD